MFPSSVLLLILWLQLLVMLHSVDGIGANWGLQASHRLPPEIVVRRLRENDIQKVSFLMQIMIGIPNDMLSSLASSSRAADHWVSQNVTHHLARNVTIRYVAVGNESFVEAGSGSRLKGEENEVTKTKKLWERSQARRIKIRLKKTKQHNQNDGQDRMESCKPLHDLFSFAFCMKN